VYSVISVIVDSLLANTKNRESTRSWTARVQFLPPSLGRGPWISLARYMERALMHWKRALYVYPIGVPLQRLFVNGFRYGAFALIHEKSPIALEKSPICEVYIRTLKVYPICVPMQGLFVKGFRYDAFEL